LPSWALTRLRTVSVECVSRGVTLTHLVPMHVLPLYSLLPNDQQMLVFRPPPEGHRLVIVSTNVAETSLTIPGIRYVVDSGRSKERTYDHSTGVQSFKVGWISKASAAQRAGRAGRTGPGHCYRLYSSALFEDHFQQFAEPEILRMPIEGVVLQMKAMAIDQVVNFPFPTPPDRQALRKAEQLLSHLGALEAPTNTRMINGAQQVGSAGGRITDLGKAMAAYPVSPRFAKMLSIGSQHGCLPYVIAIVACLSVGDPFIHEQSVEAVEEENDGHGDGDDSEVDEVDKARRADVRKRFFGAQSAFMALGNGASDMFKMLAAVGAYEYEPTPGFCAKNFLRAKVSGTGSHSTLYDRVRTRGNLLIHCVGHAGDPPAPRTALCHRRQRGGHRYRYWYHLANRPGTSVRHPAQGPPPNPHFGIHRFRGCPTRRGAQERFLVHLVSERSLPCRWTWERARSVHPPFLCAVPSSSTRLCRVYRDHPVAGPRRGTGQSVVEGRDEDQSDLVGNPGEGHVHVLKTGGNGHDR
jgi:hypothetical protein